MTGNTFPILVNISGEPRPYRMQVEVIYHSQQLTRVRITARNKEIIMEKHTVKKKPTWKIPHINFTFNTDDKTAAMAILQIQHELDLQLAAQPK